MEVIQTGECLGSRFALKQTTKYLCLLLWLYVNLEFFTNLNLSQLFYQSVVKNKIHFFFFFF